MAGDLNRVILIGRLTRDPELRQVSTGTALCRFSIANNRIYSQNGERKEEASFFNCTAWGRQAEVIHQYCQKGKQIAVEGRLRQNAWEDTEGNKRSTVEVVVENSQFLGAAGQAGSSFAASDHGNDQQQQAAPASFGAEQTQQANPNPPSSTAYENNVENDDIPF